MPVRRLPLPLAALALAAAALALPPRPAATPELSSLPEPPLAPAAEAPVHDLAGEASRQQGLAGARRLLEPVVARGGAEGAAARVHLGLLAHAREEPEVAELLLARGPGPEELEDWRLSVLADSAAANGHTATAIAALDELLARRPDSPLAERARLRLAELAWAAGDAPAATWRRSPTPAGACWSTSRSKPRSSPWSTRWRRAAGRASGVSGSPPTSWCAAPPRCSPPSCPPAR